MKPEKIHISLTSISSRMGTVHLTLESLLAQSYKNSVVHLYLSEDPYLLDEGVTVLPKAVQDLEKSSNGRLQIHYTHNYGPYRKLLPFVWHNWGKEVLVATADDDTIYPPDWLETLANFYKKYRCCIAFRGHRIIQKDGEFLPYRSWMRSQIVENPSSFILPTGKDGILYNTAFFPESVLQLNDALRLAATADDIWFRWNLAKNKIPVFVINTDYTDTLEESDYSSSLYLNYNREGGNDKVVSSVSEYFSNSYDFNFIRSSR